MVSRVRELLLPVLKPVLVELVVEAWVSQEREMVQLVAMVLRWMWMEVMVDFELDVEVWELQELVELVLCWVVLGVVWVASPW